MAGNRDNGTERREQERRRVARAMQEKAENSREIAQALYRWNAKLMANRKCAVLPGDYVAGCPGCLMSSRGAAIPASAEEIADLVSCGALSQVFDLDDLNAPDFEDQLDRVFGEIADQREYRDAHRYHASDGLERAVAVYDIPGNAPEEPAARFTVERDGDRFSFGTGSRDGDGPMRQCTYEEFNPHAADIAAALESEAKPEQGRSRSAAYEKLLEAQRANGGPAMRRPEEEASRIPGWDKMSPSEKLSAQVGLSDEYHKAMDRAAAQQKSPDAGDQWGPVPPGMKHFK